MVDEVRSDLAITDSQFGLLHGLSFALLYCIAGLPLGALIDRYPRRTIIIGGIVAWSIMTAACGLARQYGQLFITRIGVGVGEAALSPAAYSLLADCFDRQRLGRAISVYFAGGGIGAGLAFLVGGSLIAWVDGWAPVVLPMLGAMKTWQVVFIMVALPGFPIALAIGLLREPARQGRVAAAAMPSWRAVFAHLAERRRFMLPFAFGMAFVAGVSLATLSWSPAMLMRIYGSSAAEAGFDLGVLMLIGIPAGLLLGAWFAELFDRRNFREPAIMVCLLAALLLIFTTGAMGLASSKVSLLSVVFLTMVGASIPPGIAAAAIQGMVPNEMRGRTSALLLLCQNGLGMVLGPWLPGLLNDQLFGGNGRMIALSLAITVIAFSLLGFLLLLIAYLNLRTMTVEQKLVVD
jgi:MFS family permease